MQRARTSIDAIEGIRANPSRVLSPGRTGPRDQARPHMLLCDEVAFVSLVASAPSVYTLRRLVGSWELNPGPSCLYSLARLLIRADPSARHTPLP
ncbi:hypothetical protein VFPFJ_05599 [Purpureocillium lilacinum]|uniref:Uncharacterized protein n=1 Tax=Purpureocillium lilacinum TaxID=33203 RepID=A0A179H5E3_PURLI|nr:hypothetical protein VFPFJ_05599 [Purpureocillium lilacinum]OAQ84649.1 hypothetical protein VFPBJ_03417 [Purpureocillium lilacinum]OAQ89190.1 hypothetical protein VFPFJ_05599 [Purpureocillium lilacinum]